ncbi:MAG: exosortase U [Planctomycetaceae bacterium]
MSSNRVRFILGSILLAHTPMLLSYFRTLWSYEHFQFYPFALIATAMLFRQRIDWGQLQLSGVPKLLLLLDLLFLVFACIVGSPWLAAVGFAFGVWALVFASVDRQTARRPWELGLLFLSVIRPPAGLDLEIVQELQHVTTRISSDLLDRLGILHLRSGNLIELPTKRLFVEEACSGVQSFFAVIFLGLLVIAVRRRPPLHAFFLLASTAICALPMNIARVVLIAFMWNEWQVDLSSGTSHAVLGYLLLAIAAALVLSADRCWRFLGEPISSEWSTSYGERKSTNPITAAWDWCWGNFPGPTLAVTGPGKLLVATSVLVAVGFFGWQCASLFAGEGAVVQVSNQLFADAELPARLGALELETRESEERSRSNNEGQFSERWRYTGAAEECLVACDYPFTGWHSLETCYIGIGWQVEDKRLVGGTDWPAVAIRFSKPSGERGFLIYSLFDRQGQAVRPKSAVDPAATIGERLMRSNWSSAAWQTYQVQIFCAGSAASTPEDEEQILKAHEASREILRKYLQNSRGPLQ